MCGSRSPPVVSWASVGPLRCSSWDRASHSVARSALGDAVLAVRCVDSGCHQGGAHLHLSFVIWKIGDNNISKYKIILRIKYIVCVMCFDQCLPLFLLLL